MIGCNNFLYVHVCNLLIVCSFSCFIWYWVIDMLLLYFHAVFELIQ